MKKLSLLALAIALLMSTTPAHHAEAHVIEKDGTVQGVMHLSPAHEPTATEQATFKFYLSDTARTFDANAYTYTLQISGERMATSTVPVSIADNGTLIAPFVFPEPGEDFTASLTASSTQASIPSFQFEYDDIRVLPAGQHENPITAFFGEHGGHFLVLVLIIVAFVGVVVWDRVIEPKIKKRRGKS
ncbi:MAG: hypothetical protein JWL75_133 [Parcubacteria group bacterium]|nr:hypothetical protein [Parcubacteria group bacterium]